MDRGERFTTAGASTAERRWETAQVAPDEQFHVWQEVVGQAFVPVSVARCEPGPFPSSVRSCRVGAVAVSRIESEPQVVRRTARDIATHPGDVFFLNLPLGHGASASQHSRQARLRPGEFVLIDGSHEFELEFGERFAQISLALPRDTLLPVLAHPDDATALSICGTSGVGAVAAAAIRAIAEAGVGLSRHEARSLTEHLVGLIALAVGSVRSAPPSAGRFLLAQAVIDQIRQHHDNPGLNPEFVARRVGISVSYLHRLMAEHGASFGRAVLAYRLEQSRRDLEDPARAHWKIAEIGIQHGFEDPAYFARAFKRRYGCTPREHRRLALGNASESQAS